MHKLSCYGLGDVVLVPLLAEGLVAQRTYVNKILEKQKIRLKWRLHNVRPWMWAIWIWKEYNSEVQKRPSDSNLHTLTPINREK